VNKDDALMQALKVPFTFNPERRCDLCAKTYSDECSGECQGWIAPESFTIRPEIMALATMMERKLRENEDKGDWRVCRAEYLLTRCGEERDELICAVVTKASPRAILREAADVANLAMMVADNCGGLKVRV
jgi:hypothetical protein